MAVPMPPLVADGILVFDSAKAAADRYGYIDKTYTAALPSLPEEAHNGIPPPQTPLITIYVSSFPLNARAPWYTPKR
jgi:hypothetical protein